MAYKNDPIRTRTLELMESIDQDHEALIRCAGTLKSIAYDKDYLARFQTTYSAHIVNYMQRAIHRDGISCICRIWDKDKDTRSIPNLLKEIQKADVLASINSRRRGAMTDILCTAEAARFEKEYGEAGRQALKNMAHRDADNAEDKLTDEFREITTLAEAKELKALLKKARNWRHKYIAHSLAKTRIEKKAEKVGTTIEPVKWGELEKTLEYTSEIVRRLWLVVDDLNIFPAEKNKNWERYASAFWNSVNEEPE